MTSENPAKRARLELFDADQELRERGFYVNEISPSSPPVFYAQPEIIEKLHYNSMLRKILEYLTDPIDVLRARNACQRFEQNLSSQIPLARVERVLQILKKNGQSARQSRLLLSAQFLDFRRVCKAWKGAFDRAIIDHSILQFPLDSASIRTSPYHLPMIQPECRLVSEKSIDKVVNVFQSPNQSHSFLRSVRIQLPSRQPLSNPVIQRKVMDFLVRNGSCIWVLNIQFLRVIETVQGYETLRDILRLTPNLKALILGQQRKSVAQNDLQEYAELHPFPFLHHLKYLDVSAFSNPTVIASVLERNRKIAAVRLTTLHPEIRDVLSNLSLENYYGPYDIEFLSQVYWPLQKLKLLSPDLDPDESFSATELFAVINGFRATLQVLDLSAWDLEVEEDTEPLTLPFLKSISVSYLDTDEEIAEGFSGPNLTMNDLLPLASLEEIKLVGHFNRNEKSYNHFKPFFHSLPYLKLVRFEDSVGHKLDILRSSFRL